MSARVYKSLRGIGRAGIYARVYGSASHRESNIKFITRAQVPALPDFICNQGRHVCPRLLFAINGRAGIYARHCKPTIATLEQVPLGRQNL